MVGVVLFNVEGSRANWKKILEKFRKKTNIQCKDKYANIVSNGSLEQLKMDAEKSKLWTSAISSQNIHIC